MTLAGWINRRRQDVMAYIQEENRVLKTKLKGKRLRLTHDERTRLALKGGILGRTVLREVALIVTPDTMLASSDRCLIRPSPAASCDCRWWAR